MKPPDMVEFSKRFVVLISKVYIGGAIFGGVIVASQLVASIVTDGMVTADLSSYLTFLAVPLSCGIVGYMGKAAFENKEKIKKLSRDDVVNYNSRAE